MLDTEERKSMKKRTGVQELISCASTWVDGRIIFEDSRKWGNAYYGICHFENLIWAITPLDYEEPTMISSIVVSPPDNYCEKAYQCLNFGCPLNKFDKNIFVSAFKDAGGFTLGLPKDIGTKPLWFNSGKWRQFWVKLRQYHQVGPEGGQILFKDK